MSEWHIGQLAELATGIRGVAYTPDQLCEFTSPETVTLLRSNNIQSGQLDFADVQIVPRVAVSDAQVMQPGDIAVCMSNGSKSLVGKAAPLISGPAEAITVGAFCSIFRPAPGSVRSFVKHAFQSASYRKQLDLALAGSAINNLRNSDLHAFQVPIPPPGEQTQIADVLDTLDTTIRQTEAIIAKLKQVKQGLLHDLLTRGIAANGELRPPQSEAPHLYKASPLGWIPLEWHSQRLADFTASDITYGIVQAGPHIEGGIPYIRTGDMAGEYLDRVGLQCTSPRIAKSYSRSEVRTGDIVMAIRATVGKVLPVPIELDGANLTQGTARIAPNADSDPTFLLWALRFQRTRDSIAAEIKGTTFSEITLAALREIPVAAPMKLVEQRAIAERMQACERRIDAERAQLQKLRHQKSGLMDDLLTGRVRVTPLLKQEVTT